MYSTLTTSEGAYVSMCLCGVIHYNSQALQNNQTLDAEVEEAAGSTGSTRRMISNPKF